MDTVRGAAKAVTPGWGEPSPLPSMVGQTAIVTGGNAGEDPPPPRPSLESTKLISEDSEVGPNISA